MLSISFELQAMAVEGAFPCVNYSMRYLDRHRSVNYSFHVIEIRKTPAFVNWFAELRDERAKARIRIRIDRLELGLLGDAKFFDGIGELRIDYGPGYRVYFVRRGAAIVVLLCGGDKRTQSKDIERAIAMAKEV